jgi:hypothetical protein
MKRKGEKKRNPKSGLVRTPVVPQFRESLTNDRNDAAEAPILFCRDCKAPSPVESLIPVDALHVQCPQCLYVFFADGLTAKTHSGAGLRPAGMPESSPGY